MVKLMNGLKKIDKQKESDEHIQKTKRRIAKKKEELNLRKSEFQYTNHKIYGYLPIKENLKRGLL